MMGRNFVRWHWATPVLRCTSMFVGCMAVGISYLVNAFNVFALTVKKHFLLSQTQLEMLLSLMLIGLCASLPGGLILDRWGSRLAASVALVISVVGYVLLWSATWYPLFYSQHFHLLAFYFLVAGVGGGLTYISGAASNIGNFSSKKRGLVVGILHASLSTGPAIIMLVYNLYFVKDHITDVENQDINGFFLFMTVSFAAVNLLGMIFYDKYPPSEDLEEEKRLLIKDKQTKEYDELSLTCSVHKTDIEEEKSSLFIVITKEFQLLFWPCVILLSLQMMFVQNLTTILESIGYSELNKYFPYITPVLGTVAKPLLGFISDVTTRYITRSSFIFIGCVLGVLTWTLCIFFVQSVAVILIATTACDLGAYAVFALGPPIFIERFGMATFSRNWGLVMGGFALLTGSLVSVFGVVYDSHVAFSASDCYGPNCFKESFILALVISLIAIGCMMLYCLLEKLEREAKQHFRIESSIGNR